MHLQEDMSMFGDAGNVFLWDRLGASSAGPVSPYLAEFVVKKATPPKAAVAPTPAKPAMQRRGRSGPSAVCQEEQVVAVKAAVHAAVEAVLGAGVGEDQPLMEGGLDSLGGSLYYSSGDMCQCT